MQIKPETKEGLMPFKLSVRLLLSTAILTCASSFGFANSGLAQGEVSEEVDAVAAAKDDQDSSSITVFEEITATGTRIKRTGFSSATPSSVITSDTINDFGQVNAAEILRLIPQNSAFQSDATAGIQNNPNIGASFANLRGLNPFFGTRTLTLVNTRRFIPTSAGGAVDLNVIPSSMIARVETVTGGASAAYGSDAVAGVVNIILDTEMEGWRGQVDYGQTFRGDGESMHASVAWGGSFAGDRGHIVLGTEYQDQQGIGDCAKVRLWCAEGWDIFRNRSSRLPDGSLSGYDIPGSPGYGLPNYILGTDSKQAFNDPRGVVRYRNPAPLEARNIAFTEDGTGIIQFDTGQYVASSTFGPRQGGDGASTYADSDIQTPQERKVGYLYGDYEISDSLEVYTEFSFSHLEASSTNYTVGPRSSYLVKATNPYLPQALVDLLGGSSFSLGKDLDGQVTTVNKAVTKTFRGLVGAKGEFGDSWTWDAYYQYGSNKRNQNLSRSRLNPAFIFALDAVVDPDTGNIVCAETLEDNPNPIAEGCAPMNLFGINNLSQEAIDYVWRPVPENFDYKQHVFSASVQGELSEGWGAGPIGTAAGFDYRIETGDVTHEGIENANDYAFTFGLDYAGKIKVAELFAEVNLPIFKDMAFGDSFELNGGIRYTKNTSKDTLTGDSKTSDAISWKVSGIYDMTEDLRFRGSRSRDIRAAGFRELFLKRVPTSEFSAQGRVDNPNIPGSPLSGDDPTPILTGGAFSLGVEKADTTTFGVVYSPSFVPGLRLSVDWFNIKIADAITSLDGQLIVDFCTNFDTFCDRITYASPTDITFVNATQVNVGAFSTSGFDVEVDYTFSLRDVVSSWSGDLSLRAMGTNQYSFLIQPNTSLPAVDYAGQTGPVDNAGDFNPTPDWVWNFIVSYEKDAFQTSVLLNYVSAGTLDTTLTGPDDPSYDPSLLNSISNNRVDSAIYVTLSMSYDISVGGDRAIEIFGVINNLFDARPSIAPGGGSIGGSDYPTNPAYFDTFGARFRTGVRFRF